MKALSIIGIVLSVVLMILALAVTDISCSSYYMGEYWGSSRQGEELGMAIFVGGAFFLAFSIVATVSSFKKKA